MQTLQVEDWGHLVRRYAIIFVVVAPALCGTGCRQALSPESARQFQQAIDQERLAQTPEQHLLAAAAYEALRDQGVESAELLFNQGNAYLRGGQRGRAIASYRAALRFRPRDARIRHNLEQAQQTDDAEQASSLMVRMDPSRWLAVHERMLLGTGLAALAALLGCAWLLLGWRQTFWPAALAVLLSLAWLGSGLEQWRRATSQSEAIVIREAPLREGPSLGIEARPGTAVAEGQAVRIEQRQDQWLRIRTATGQSGWLTPSDVVVY